MLQEAALHLVEQLRAFLLQCEDENYSKPIGALGDSSIGQHVRHSLEFFLCLLNGRSNQRICYDDRPHDIVLETNRKAAIACLEGIGKKLSERTDDFSVDFFANYDKAENQNVHIQSSFHRELAYTIEHTIHHMALIAVGVRLEVPYICLPEDFGVASSTLRYRESQMID